MAMFEQTFVATAKTHKMGTVLVSLAAETILVAIGILIPMIYFDALPTAQLRSLLLAPPPLPPTPPTPPPEAPKVVKFIPRQFEAGKLMAPQGVPQKILMFKEDDWPAPSVVGSVGVSADTLVRILGPVPVAAPPPPPSVQKNVQTPRARRQHPAGRQIDSPAEASLSTTGQAGPHSGSRQAPCLDLQGRHHRRAKGRQRPPAACHFRLRSGETVGISAHPTQRSARGSGNGHRRELYTEPVSAPTVADGIGECITPTAE